MEMSHSIQCVHCQAVLKSPVPVPAGKKVKCPKCNESFATPGAAPEAAKSYSLQCVHCQAVLKSPTPVPAGKTVKCPKCNESFTAPDLAPPPAPEKPAPKPMPASLNISIFTGDADAAIASLMSEAGGKTPEPKSAALDDDLVTEEDAEEGSKKG